MSLIYDSSFDHNQYAYGDDLVDRLSITIDDDNKTVVSRLVGQSIGAASRNVDGVCGRHFYPQVIPTVWTQSRNRYRMGVRDLIELESLQIRPHANSEGETLPPTDYVLYPDIADPNYLPGEPYRGIQLTGDKKFPDAPSTVGLTGVWGYRSSLFETGAYIENSNVGVAITPASVSIPVTSYGNLKVGMLLNIDTEYLFIRVVGAGVLNVTRGVNGSTRASHDDGSSIFAITYPSGVVEATLRLAAYFYLVAGGKSPLTILEGTDRYEDIADPWSDVRRILRPYIRKAL